MSLLKLYVTVKEAGKKRAKISNREFVIVNKINTLKDLLTEIVTDEVNKPNTKGFEEQIFKFLENSEIEDKAYTGKVSFSEKHNENKQDLNKAIDNAMQSFEDGIYRVFINDEEIEKLNDELILMEGDNLAFIKLTMLSGRLW